MELQFEKTEIPVLATALREVKHTELTQEVKLSDGMPDIGRVLTSWGQVLLRSKEWNRDEIGMSGAVMVWTLYLPEDGTEPRSVESWIPFQLSWDIAQGLREGAIHTDVRPRFVDARGISSRKIMVRCGISALCHAYSPSSGELYAPGEMPEDVQLLKRTYPVRIPREAGEKTFTLDEELMLPESVPQMEKMLSYSLRPEVTDRKVIGNRVAFKGNGNLHVVYRCGEGKIRTADFDLPFSQFSELEREYGGDANGDVQVAATSLEADSADSGKIRLKAGMVGQYRVDDRQLMEVTEDAYSPYRDVNIRSEMLEIPSVLDDQTEMITAEQAVPGQSGHGVDVNFFGDFPVLRRNGENVRLELPGMFQMLMTGEDGTLQGVNARWEGNSSINADENTQIEAVADPMGRAEAIPGTDGMTLRSPLKLRMRSTSETRIPMVTGLELGEQKEPDPGRPSLVLRRAGDDDLWTIAKCNGSTVSAIRMANDLQSEPDPDRMLLVPVS